VTEVEDKPVAAYGGGAFDGMSSAIANDPQPVYKHLRKSGGAVRTPAGVIAATRSDVDEVFHEYERFTATSPIGRMGNSRPLIPLELDPPDHRKFRKLLDPLFTPKRMALLEPAVVELCNRLIDGFIDEPEIDFVAQFSNLLPTSVFLAQLGLPLEKLDYFLKLKDGAVRSNHLLGVPYTDPAAIKYRMNNGKEIYAAFNEALDEREVERRDDLLSYLLDAEIDGEKLTREELLDVCFLFLTAGLDTVSASLDCFFEYLAKNPEKRAELVADPEIAMNVVEELLRWESPVQLLARIATGDTELSGCPVKKGELVFTLIGAANTDAETVEDPDEVRFDRYANRHIAFGSGVHRCLGSHLARLELRIVLQEWHKRIPNYRIKPGATVEHFTAVRSAEAFPMELGVSL
jgi:cytochrome P450